MEVTNDKVEETPSRPPSKYPPFMDKKYAPSVKAEMCGGSRDLDTHISRKAGMNCTHL